MAYSYLPEVVIGFLLEEKQVGCNPASGGQWPIFVSSLADKPHDCIGVFSTSVPTQGRIHRTGETVGPWGFQIRVRASNFQDAQSKVTELLTVLDETINFELAVEDVTVKVSGIHRTGTPVYLGPDDNNRFSFSINCITTFKEV